MGKDSLEGPGHPHINATLHPYILQLPLLIVIFIILRRQQVPRVGVVDEACPFRGPVSFLGPFSLRFKARSGSRLPASPHEVILGLLPGFMLAAKLTGQDLVHQVILVQPGGGCPRAGPLPVEGQLCPRLQPPDDMGERVKLCVA
ncbi:MAG: hypothetical protein FRX49_10595 [Trebouxia sp. A1-2]|nr:MAG: hypothetical protein FRX49_10595 [Trebouxia sp. A1-2]